MPEFLACFAHKKVLARVGGDDHRHDAGCRRCVLFPDAEPPYYRYYLGFVHRDKHADRWRCGHFFLSCDGYQCVLAAAGVRVDRQ